VKNFPHLNATGLWPVEAYGRKYLYAPLVGMIVEAEISEIDNFELSMSSGEMPDELRPLVTNYNNTGILSPEQTSELTILINQRCNFACKYCYSANGRSSSELNIELFPVLSDWFVRNERLDASGAKQLNVTFSGGGDPTLSMDKVRRLVEMMSVTAESKNIPITFSMVCNGSRIQTEDISFIRDNIENIVISFDVIPEVHNAQRSHYHIVAETMRKLSDNGVKYGLRSTITPLNVGRMEEMIETLHKDFPQCRSIATEVVFDSKMWNTETELLDFYDRFFDSFFKAQQLADRYDISLGNTIEISSDGLKTRACEGKVVVTPDGKLTACSRVATPGDHKYNDFLFGEVTTDGVTYDKVRYDEIMSVNADRFKECDGCFARYHCGGGCMLLRLSYSPAQMKLHCNLTRKILKHKIFYELDR
jgi:radical SAM protein with 4Fe4S-binding SPASM domain